VCARPAVGLAARLAAKLMAGCAAGAIGVADYAGVLRAIYIVLMVWFREFLALYHLAYALIQRRPWLIDRQ